MSHKQNDIWYEARERWLDENFFRKEGDVMQDAQGEYIMVAGEEQEEKVYLPANLQSSYVPDLD